MMRGQYGAAGQYVARRSPIMLFIALCTVVSARDTGLSWSWDTLGSMRYSFCGNASGPLNDEAVEVSFPLRHTLHRTEIHSQKCEWYALNQQKRTQDTAPTQMT